MSRNCHKGLKLHRKDDLESIIYIMMFMLDGTLPWFHLYSPEVAARYNEFNVSNRKEGERKKKEFNEKEFHTKMLEVKESRWKNTMNPFKDGFPELFKQLVTEIMNVGETDEPPYD